MPGRRQQPNPLQYAGNAGADGYFPGGILTTGGFSAKLYKVIIGSITITVIENGLTICRASSAVSEAVEGILLVIILCTTIYFNNVSEKHTVRLSTNSTMDVEA